MTILINDVAPRAHYVATHGQTVFAVPFEWLKNSDVIVYVNEVIATFDAPPLDALHYSLTGEGIDGGGTVTFGPPGRLAGDQVIIVRDMHIDSPVDFPQTGIFPVAALNNAFDEMTAGIQQAEIGYERRALRMWKNDFLYQVNPIPMSYARAGKLLGFDANGHPVAVGKDEVGGGGEGSGARVWTGDNPPPLPWKDGDLWWESDTGQLFVFYEDGDSGQWVETSAGGGSSTSSDYVTPQMFGAIGNGSTDDTDAVQQAIDAGIGRKLPVLINKQHLCNDASLTITGPVKIISYSGLIVAPTHRSVFVITSSNVSIDGLTITGGGNATLNTSGKLIDVRGVANGAGVAPTYLNNIKITNCRLSQAGQMGVYFNYVDTFEISGNTISDVGYSGIQCDSCHVGEVLRNTVSNVSPGAVSGSVTLTYGIALGSVNNADLVRYPTCSRMVVDYNRIINSPWEGIDCHGGDRLSFSFNTIRACGSTNSAISITHRDSGSGNTDAIDPATNVRCIGNIIREALEMAIVVSAGNPTGTGTLKVTHENIVIADNVIYDAGDLTVPDPLVRLTGGIRIAAVRGCVVSGNVLQKVAPYGIIVASDRSSGVSIVGNSFIDMVSNTYATPSAIYLNRVASIPFNECNVTVTGNVITAGTAAVTFKNITGVLANTADTGKMTFGMNNFDAAQFKYNISATQLIGAGEPVVNAGLTAVPIVAGGTTASVLVTLTNTHVSTARYFCWGSILSWGSASNNGKLALSVIRTSASSITLEVWPSGATFPASGNVNVMWRTGGF
jgi:hypothetical protein